MQPPPAASDPMLQHEGIILPFNPEEKIARLMIEFDDMLRLVCASPSQDEYGQHDSVTEVQLAAARAEAAVLSKVTTTITQAREQLLRHYDGKVQDVRWVGPSEFVIGMRGGAAEFTANPQFEQQYETLRSYEVALRAKIAARPAKTRINKVLRKLEVDLKHPMALARNDYIRDQLHDTVLALMVFLELRQHHCQQDLPTVNFFEQMCADADAENKTTKKNAAELRVVLRAIQRMNRAVFLSTAQALSAVSSPNDEPVAGGAVPVTFATETESWDDYAERWDSVGPQNLSAFNKWHTASSVNVIADVTHSQLNLLKTLHSKTFDEARRIKATHVERFLAEHGRTRVRGAPKKSRLPVLSKSPKPALYETARAHDALLDRLNLSIVNADGIVAAAPKRQTGHATDDGAVSDALSSKRPVDEVRKTDSSFAVSGNHTAKQARETAAGTPAAAPDKPIAKQRAEQPTSAASGNHLRGRTKRRPKITAVDELANPVSRVLEKTARSISETDGKTSPGTKQESSGREMDPKLLSTDMKAHKQRVFEAQSHYKRGLYVLKPVRKKNESCQQRDPHKGVGTLTSQVAISLPVGRSAMNKLTSLQQPSPEPDNIKVVKTGAMHRLEEIMEQYNADSTKGDVNKDKSSNTSAMDMPYPTRESQADRQPQKAFLDVPCEMDSSSVATDRIKTIDGPLVQAVAHDTKAVPATTAVGSDLMSIESGDFKPTKSARPSATARNETDAEQGTCATSTAEILLTTGEARVSYESNFVCEPPEAPPMSLFTELSEDNEVS